MPDNPSLRNQPAERLRAWIRNVYPPTVAQNRMGDLGEALAAERLKVVDWLIARHDCRDADMDVPCSFHAAERNAVLDAEIRGDYR